MVVPRASTRRKADVSSEKAACAIVEKKNADSPNPAATSPTAVDLWYVRDMRVRLLRHES